MLKPQDISVLCMLAVYDRAGRGWNYVAFSKEICLSTGEVHASVKRLSELRLYNLKEKSVIAPNVREFFIHGVKYCFPVELGGMERGFPTAYSHSDFAKDFLPSSDNMIIPHQYGKSKGIVLKPISANIPEAIYLSQKKKGKNEFYLFLALVDAIRVGKAREREIAVKLLETYI